MNAAVFLDACLEEGIDFYSGVPDSFLSALCNELFLRYGTDGHEHIVAHNEGGAIALCAGHYLATGRPGLCYMQNSGLGNAVNPLASLTDQKVYGIPCLLVIGWRGQPGQKDEPQHVRQGAVTLDQLTLLDIPWRILPTGVSRESFLSAFHDLLPELKRGRVSALVLEKEALSKGEAPDYRNPFRMSREDAAGILLNAAAADDVFVCTTGKLSREVFEWRERRKESHEKDFLTVGSMGHASMIALRLAEECPYRRIWCLDGDGAMLMHLGALAIIGERHPRNLIHVVINNQAHETVGGLPVCNRHLPVAELAHAAGYASVQTVCTAKELEQLLSKLTDCPLPLLLEVRCANGARPDLGRPTSTPNENRDALMAYIQKQDRTGTADQKEG